MKRIFLNNNENEDVRGDVFELEYEDLNILVDDNDLSFFADMDPRPFSMLQSRVRNAVSSLLRNRMAKTLCVCGSTRVNTIEILSEIVQKECGQEPIIAYAPTRFEFFGNENENGVMSSEGVVIIPASLLLDHPKWLNPVDACLAQNSKIKLIICGDALDCAELTRIWPALDNGLRSDIVMEFNSSSGLSILGGLLKDYVNKYQLSDFSQEAVKYFFNYCCRQSGDRRWIYIPELKLRELALESHNYAKGESIEGRHVLKALVGENYRVNYLAESELRNYRDEQILLETEGEVVGQINGLSVIESVGSSYEYGTPVRITATLRAGGDGDVIDIEHKAELAGQIHAKAMMIINGFLANEFGSAQPMPVSASLVFEQSYSEIDGDSASLTGLCAVISALSNLPIKQDLAVTGAVDQFGDVQSVGGINEKIEGFYRICRLRGLNGRQGVVIPLSCICQLVLKPAVMKAVRDGNFHIYAVDHVEGACRILMNAKWDSEDSSICDIIWQRLEEIQGGKNKAPWWKFFKG